MVSGQRVLVVDGLSETEEVLRAVLEPRGLRVERVRTNEHREEKSSDEPPRVVVIHIDEAHRSRNAADRNWADVPRVVIGSGDLGEADDLGGPRQFLQKPFQYRELIQAIDSLLADKAA